MKAVAMRPRVKFCGLTQVDEAVAAARMGVDAIGLVFYEKSSRRVSVAQARTIRRALPPFVTTVALFVDAAEQQVETVITQVGVDMLQFHGQEDAGQCRRYGVPYLKAVRMRDMDVLHAALDEHGADASGLLLDAYHPGQPGGTGCRFDWRMLAGCSLSVPWILAGGLQPDNVALAVQQVQPYGVDVSGGIEDAPGRKSLVRMQAFMQALGSS